jgi:hypothetical protein
VTLETLIHGGVVVVLGVLIIQARKRFSRSMIQQLRGFKNDITSEGLRRFWAIGLAMFGALVIVIGVSIALGSPIIG